MRHCVSGFAVGRLSALVVVSVVGSSCTDALESMEPHVAGLLSLDFREELRIGSVDDPVLGFSQIRRVAVSGSGNAYVLDGLSREIRVFGAQGERIMVLGGPGEGPGEFGSPNLIGLLGDTLWVTDPSRRRMTWFGPDGEVLFTIPTDGVLYDPGIEGPRISLVPSRPQANGLIESGRSMGVAPTRQIRPYEYPVLRFNRRGEVVDTIRWEATDIDVAVLEVGGAQGYAPVLGLSRPTKTEGETGSVVVDWLVLEGGPWGVLDVLWLNSRGDTIARRQLRYDPIPTPPEVLDSIIMPRVETLASVRGVTPAEMERALREAVQLPSHRPPIRVVHAGADGTAWLQLNTAAVDVIDWVVLSADGSVLGRVGLPPGVQIYHSALPTVWAVDVDDLDVPWLLRLSVE